MREESVLLLVFLFPDLVHSQNLFEELLVLRYLGFASSQREIKQLLPLRVIDLVLLVVLGVDLNAGLAGAPVLVVAVPHHQILGQHLVQPALEAVVPVTVREGLMPQGLQHPLDAVSRCDTVKRLVIAGHLAGDPPGPDGNDIDFLLELVVQPTRKVVVEHLGGCVDAERELRSKRRHVDYRRSLLPLQQQRNQLLRDHHLRNAVHLDDVHQLRIRLQELGRPAHIHADVVYQDGDIQLLHLLVDVVEDVGIGSAVREVRQNGLHLHTLADFLDFFRDCLCRVVVADNHDNVEALLGKFDCVAMPDALSCARYDRPALVEASGVFLEQVFPGPNQSPERPSHEIKTLQGVKAAENLEHEREVGVAFGVQKFRKELKTSR